MNYLKDISILFLSFYIHWEKSIYPLSDFMLAVERASDLELDYFFYRLFLSLIYLLKPL